MGIHQNDNLYWGKCMTIQKILVVHHVRTTPQKGLLQGTLRKAKLKCFDYPAWWTYKKQWKMAIEIVDFPIKNGDFPWQNVRSPEGNHALRAMHLKFVDLIVWNCLSLQQSHRAVQDKLKPTYHWQVFGKCLIFLTIPWQMQMSGPAITASIHEDPWDLNYETPKLKKSKAAIHDINIQ